jgi:hypothetical protein
MHRPTSVWTLLESVNSVIGLTALYRIVRALRWDDVRDRGPTDLGRYRRSPRGPKRWRPYTSWGRFTSRGGVHGRRTKRQLANCFGWLYVRTSFLTPSLTGSLRPDATGRREGTRADERASGPAPRSTPTALHWRLARREAAASRWRAPSATAGVRGQGEGCAAGDSAVEWRRDLAC